MTDKKRVLFLCVGNSCRSQMAEGFLRTMAPEIFEVNSAGAVASGVNPNAITVMKELGFDISQQKSKRIDDFAGQAFDYVITLCESSEFSMCPVFLGQMGNHLHWPFEDPIYATGSEQDVLTVFRCIRDRIKVQLEHFVNEQVSR